MDENMMTTTMLRAVDDATLAREWAARLATPGRDRWMNETTAGRLLSGLRSGRLNNLILVSLADPGLPAERLARFMDPTVASAAVARLNRPDWTPDRARLENADRDLDALSRLDPEHMGDTLPARAIIAWLAGDAGRARICLTAWSQAPCTPAGDLTAVVVQSALRFGLAPAGRHADAEPVAGPDMLAAYAAAHPLDGARRAQVDLDVWALAGTHGGRVPERMEVQS